MISFRETLDAIQRISDLLKASEDIEESVERSKAALHDLRTMLDADRLRQFETAGELADYIHRIAIPQLTGAEDTLEGASAAYLKRLKMASEQTNKLMVRLQMLDDASLGGLF
jgi:hypothetical protein